MFIKANEEDKDSVAQTALNLLGRGEPALLMQVYELPKG